MAFDSNGNFYVVDSYNHRIQKFGRRTPSCTIGEILPPVNDVSSAMDTSNMSAYKAGSRGSIPTKFQVTCNGNLIDTPEEAETRPMVLTLTRLASSTDPEAVLEPT